MESRLIEKFGMIIQNLVHIRWALFIVQIEIRYSGTVGKLLLFYPRLPYKLFYVLPLYGDSSNR